MKRLVLVSGSSNPLMSAQISEILDVSLVGPQLTKFANGEIFCEIEKNVRGADVFVIQSACAPVNDNLMELLIMIDALKRASASSITAVMPHYGYARQDRKVSPRTPITAKLVADLLTVAGASRVMTMDLHTGQIQGFFNIPFDNLYAQPVFFQYIKDHLMSDKLICVSPDSGGMERTRLVANKLKAEIAMIDKRRVAKNVAKAINIVGDIKGRECIIIDDMIDTAGTLVEAAKALMNGGATKVHALATHAIFSNPAISRIQDCEELSSVIVTDTIPLSKLGLECPKVKVLSVSEIFAKAIHRIYNDNSVSSLFY